MLNIRTILHPTDFSERSTWAFRLACALAHDLGAGLIVLHVAPPPAPDPNGMLKKEYERLWDALVQVRAGEPAIQLEHQFRPGEPAEEILHMARASKCDLIVMGTHGRTGLSRLLMGSVAEAVLRQAPCPVLTVKAPFPLAVPAAGASAREALTA